MSSTRSTAIAASAIRPRGIARRGASGSEFIARLKASRYDSTSITTARILLASDERLNPEAERQLPSVVELDQRLEYFGVDALGRLVRANVLASEQPADLNDASGEATVAEGVGCHIGVLSDDDVGHVSFVHVDADAADAVVGQCDDRRIELRRYALTGFAVAA